MQPRHFSLPFPMPTHRRVTTVQNVADTLFQNIAVGQQFRTPDTANGRLFTIVQVRDDAYTVQTQSGNSLLTIGRINIERAYQYLLDHDALPESPIAIASDKVWDHAGPLCRAARGRAGTQMIITYILPVLAQLGIVGIGGTRPNTTWIIRPESN